MIDTGARPISVPVVWSTKGRVWNVTGDCLNEDLGGIWGSRSTSVGRTHRPGPQVYDLEPKTEMLETGIKVLDQRTRT